jgi:hypothetical protein
VKPSISLSAALALGGLAVAATPPPGAVKGLAQVLAWAPQSVRDAYADAGFVFAQQGPYVQFNVRAWYDPDSGAVGFPSMPDGVQVLRIKRAGAGCAVAGLCVDDAPGAVDPVAEVQLDCGCSSGATCAVANPDGGVYPDGGPRPVPAPLGVTLEVGTFKGAGCVRKACVELAGQESSWPTECPCPSIQPDGGGGC